MPCAWSGGHAGQGATLDRGSGSGYMLWGHRVRVAGSGAQGQGHRGTGAHTRLTKSIEHGLTVQGRQGRQGRQGKQGRQGMLRHAEAC